ncbi:MAG: KilA-N domain-containing protein [Alphaproteobacteria bacterium]|nr:KilA-N domain-containing protein [Alphaproteobacteria bacterium]
MDNSLSVAIRGKSIRFDENGLACLNDIWRAAGLRKNQTPADWMRLTSAQKLQIAVLEKTTGKSRGWTKTEYRSVSYAAGGIGTYADIRLALAYAEYLNPKLALEVREVFLRYKAADATLADEILQEASEQDNEWAAKRALSRAIRNGYTDTLRDHGVTNGKDFGRCTNATYKTLFGCTAKQLKEQKGVGGNLRDHMTKLELSAIMTSEALSSERIEDERCEGAQECKSATEKSAGFIRRAIEDDRKDRRSKML